jgi:hypothetical protein
MRGAWQRQWWGVELVYLISNSRHGSGPAGQAQTSLTNWPPSMFVQPVQTTAALLIGAKPEI